MENQIMPKQYIEFKCQHQKIERTDDFFVVGGSQRYLYAKFDLCSDWSGFQQYAVFTGGLKTFRIPIVDGECEVPWEMLLEKRFFVGCEAGQRITSNAAEVKVHPCGAPEETGTPRKPTPTLQSQIGNLGDLKTEAKNNLVDAINEVYDNPGGGSTPGEPGADGEDGGYYIPNVSQVDENTMSVSFAASKEGMADVADQEITLPSGKNGADGKPGADGKDGSPGVDGKNGSDGITPHIGANGNWFIGEEDTGVSAGVTDEQISGAVEEYMEENPLVKTVNGTAPDENGNVELDIQPGAIPAPETAEVGQTIVVKEVDENGKPTAWEAADLPSGGSVSKWVEAVNMVTAEDVRELVVNKDKNGNSFSFDEIHCSIKFVGTDANTKEDSVEYRTLHGDITKRGPNLPLIYAQRVKGSIDHHIHSLITPSGFGIHDSYRADTLAQIRAMSGSFTVKPITGIRLWAYSEYIAKGTTIVIYGRNRESEV